MRWDFLTKAIAGSIIGGLVITALTLHNVTWNDVTKAFGNATPGLLLAYVSISILIAIGVTMKWHVALDAYKVKLPFYTLFIYRIIGFAVSYLTPMAHVGGEPVRALLIGRQGIPMKISFSAVIVDKSLEILFNVIIFFLGAVIIFNLTEFPFIARLTILVLSMIAAAVAAILSYRFFNKQPVFSPLIKFFRLHKRSKGKDMLKGAEEMEQLLVHFYHNRQAHFFKVMMLNVGLWILMFIEYGIALRIIGYEASIYGIFLFLTGVGIAYSIPIPAALGVLELGQISASALLGLRSSIGAALAFLIRIRDVVWTVLGVILLGMLHLNFFKLYDKSQKAAEKYKFHTLHAELKGLSK